MNCASLGLQQALVRAAMLLLCACFPFDEQAARRRYSLNDLHDEYCWWRLGSVPVFLFGWSACSAAWYYALRYCAEGCCAPRIDDVAYLPPPTIAWVFSAALLGMLSCSLLAQQAYQWLLGERYEEFETYSDWMAGFNSRQASPYFLAPLAVAAVVCVALSFDCEARCTQDEIVVNRFAGIGETRYSYADVKAVVDVSRPRVKCGKKCEDPCTIVFFSSGESCNSTIGRMSRRAWRLFGKSPSGADCEFRSTTRSRITSAASV